MFEKYNQNDRYNLDECALFFKLPHIKSDKILRNGYASDLTVLRSCEKLFSTV